MSKNKTKRQKQNKSKTSENNVDHSKPLQIGPIVLTCPIEETIKFPYTSLKTSWQSCTNLPKFIPFLLSQTVHSSNPPTLDLLHGLVSVTCRFEKTNKIMYPWSTQRLCDEAIQPCPNSFPVNFPPYNDTFEHSLSLLHWLVYVSALTILYRPSRLILLNLVSLRDLN